MNWRIATALVLALAMVPLLPAVQASHFQAYGNYPYEHDDLGQSLEPDFFGSTGILGVPVDERAIDLNLNGFGEPSSGFPPGAILAPGCTDDAGRQPSGLCGLYTIGALNGLGGGTESGIGIPPRTLGVQGMSGTNAPGLTGAKGVQVHFLDQKAVADNSFPGTGTVFTDFNAKLRDAGVSDLLAGLDSNLGGQFMFYSMAHYVWYGRWADKNGNGVIDSLQAGINPANGNPIENPDNEFVWYGNCKNFDGGYTPGWHCVDESASVPGGAVEIASYIYPGNHHAYCGALVGNTASNLCDKVGIDMPGANLLCLADALTAPVLPVTRSLLGRCFTNNVGEVDENEALFEGDTIFGIQDSIAPDQTYDDRSGDQAWDTRGWYYGLGWATFYYDQSLVTSTSIITVANCPEDPAGSARHYDVANCRFVDVDQYPTWSPVLEDLVVGLKPTARSQFVFVRDNAGPVSSGLDGQVNNQRTDLSATTGPLDDQLQDPGFAREPNHAGDAYPGATFNVDGCAAGQALHHGWCNDYSGYRAASRGWIDGQVFRSLTYDRAVQATGSGCQLCVSGPGLTVTLTPEPIDGGLRGPGDYRRSLGPGGYFLSGAEGRWKDNVQYHVEDFLDLNLGSPTFGTNVHNEYILAPDGWVGSIVNATGAFYYRGYQDQECTTEDGPGTYPYAFCHPYSNGVSSDPQQAGGTQHGEWATNACDSTSNPGNEIQLIPAGGTWTVPILIARNHAFIQVPGYIQQGQLQDFTGTSGPINIGINCFEQGGFLSNDFIILPIGNLGLDITTQLTARIPLLAGGFDTVVDVDVYEGWGA